MTRDSLPADRRSDKLSHGGLQSDEAVTLYIIVLFLLFLIAAVSMYQTRRSDLLRKEIDALKNQMGVTTEQQWTSDP